MPAGTIGPRLLHSILMTVGARGWLERRWRIYGRRVHRWLAYKWRQHDNHDLGRSLRG
jgi:hypothetical protein